MATTETTELHVAGDALLAVAEGNPERQPDEATLAHIFSCASCSQNVREMRQGLSGLAAVNGPVLSAEEMLEADPGLSLADAEEFDAERRARSLIWKVAVIGALLVLGMLWLKSSAASLG